MTLEKIILKCNEPIEQVRFYRDVLGMQEVSENSVRYGLGEASLVFEQASTRYTPEPNDLYWKISIAIPKIELACRQLQERSVTVGEARQFGEIAYLAHFQDPEGFTIELIDHWFKDNRPSEIPVDTTQFGGGAHLNLLTLRSSDIESDLEGCKSAGMKLLCVMPVETRGFTLYFLGAKEESPPSSNVYAIENREWVFQRKSTVLEIQHIHDWDEVRPTKKPEAGYVGAQVSGAFGDVDSLLLGREK